MFAFRSIIADKKYFFREYSKYYIAREHKSE